MGLHEGDASLEALKVTAAKVHVLLDPPSVGSHGLPVGLHEAFEFLMNSITACKEAVQPELGVVPVFIQASRHNLPEREAMSGRNQKRLQEAPQMMLRCAPMSLRPPHPLM